MKLHEHQAKALFQKVGIPVPRGIVATTAEEASVAYVSLKQLCADKEPFSCNVKAQMHAGGRGKAGGVLVADGARSAGDLAGKLIGQRLVTHQTGAEGLPVSSVLLEVRIFIAKELYLAITLDRFQARPMVLASREGGMDIEAVAAQSPQAIVREGLDFLTGPSEEACARLAQALDLKDTYMNALSAIVRALWGLYDSSDASLIEINPLVLTTDGRLLALDAKVTIDDSALFRHEDLAVLRDESQEDALELKAGRIGISYVGLDGNIGCLVNGAGLAMATNDVIKLAGGSPANFLDVGGGANVDQVTSAFSIILSDKRVKVVLVNIFGGIMRCDWIAQGLLNATEKLEVKVPIVVRLQGTNVEEGCKMLNDAKRLSLISVNELEDAARKAVELVNQ